MITILSPKVNPGDRALRLAPRPADLNGKTIGFLDNGKRNFDVFLERTEQLLQEKFNFNAIYRRKPHALKAAPAELLQELVEATDVIITGSGD
ncbi:MAG: hypothetical protein HYY45_09695 [Deltaproteobacteria bacterium]|nr:hypothetical protein [Deltaproteobacteria bacterium]